MNTTDTTTKQVKDLKAGEEFKLSPDAKRIWIMGHVGPKWNFTRYYDHSTKKYTCVPSDDVFGCGRELSGDKQVFTGFTH